MMTTHPRQQQRNVYSFRGRCLLILFLRSAVTTYLWPSVAEAFVPAIAFRGVATHSDLRVTPLYMSFFVDRTQKETAEEKVEPVIDPNGKVVTVGAVVRVSKAGLKAFQISNKAKGTFDENKAFVPDTSDKPDGLKYIVLPIGLRGTVTKVFDVNRVSANFPVQVKFVPGQHTDEGYDTPAPFSMHFMAEELEVVE